MSFPPGTEMFQFPGFASPKPILFSLVIPLPFNSAPDCSGSKLNGEGGFPHSEICGSKVAHTSPQLIAACHVLHRLCMPRHPPNALTSRLKIHTTNDSTARLKCSLYEDRALSSDTRHLVRTARELDDAGDGIDFKKPIHNVKDGRRQ